MKQYLLLLILCAMAIMIPPLVLGAPFEKKEAKATEETSKTTKNPTITNTEEKPQQTESTVDTIDVFLSQKNTTKSISMYEYICGSVAAEMPLAYEEEALKAQAIACYTNALRVKKGTQGKISDNPATHQGYINKEERKEKWGKDFVKYEKKLQNIVKEVYGKAIYYKNDLCVAAFCAISNGKTESAQNIWGSKIPYLISVDSEGDKLSPGYASSASFTKKEAYSLLKKDGFTEKELKSTKELIKITKKSSTGTVLKCTIAGKEFTGEQVRKIFSLRSPTFKVKIAEDSVIFSVFGYGHGIGMSQYGANYYAENGYTYQDIIAHYYKGTTIK